MDLNILNGNVNANDMIYAGSLLKYVGSGYSVTGQDGGGFISVGNLMTLANNALANYSSAHTDAVFDYLDALEDALEAANTTRLRAIGRPLGNTASDMAGGVGRCVGRAQIWRAGLSGCADRSF